MIKIILVVLALCGAVLGTTNYYIDPSVGGGSNNGTSTDNAWQSCSTGVAQSRTGPAIVWFRRTANFTLGATASAVTFNASVSGMPNQMVVYAACPRAAKALTANATQGERVINTTSIAFDVLKYGAREVFANTDSIRYLITAPAVLCSLVNGYTGTFRRYDSVSDKSAKNGKIMQVGTNKFWFVSRTGIFATNDSIVSTNARAKIASVDSLHSFVIDNYFVGSDTTGGHFTICEDPLKDAWDTINDAGFTIKKAAWEAESDSMPMITFTGTQYINLPGNFCTLQGFYYYESGSAQYGGLNVTGRAVTLRNMWFNQSPYQAVYFNGKGGNILYNCVIDARRASNNKYQSIINSAELTRIENVSVYGNPSHYAYTGYMNAYMKNCNFGVELNNVMDMNVWCGSIYGNNILCGGDTAKIRTPSGDCYDCGIYIENWQKKYGNNISKVHLGFLRTQTAGATTNPKIRTGGSPTIMKLTMNGTLTDVGFTTYVPTYDIHPVTVFTRNVYFSDTSKTDTIKVFIQNASGGNINTTDSINRATIWLDLMAPEKYVSDSVWNFKRSSDQSGVYLRSTSSANPIANRADSTDWDFLKLVYKPKAAGNVVIRCLEKYSAANFILYIDPKIVITTN